MPINPEHDYAEAHLPFSWRIMGVRLLPFRAGHKLILHREKSPLISPDYGIPEIKHLAFALWVCSRSYAGACNSKLSLYWRWRIARMTRELAREEDLFYSRVEMFCRYVAEAHAKPKRMRTSQDDGKMTYAPSLMVLKRDLMGKVCFTSEQFLEMPLRLAYYERWGQLEQQGLVEWPEAWEAGR